MSHYTYEREREREKQIIHFESLCIQTRERSGGEIHARLHYTV